MVPIILLKETLEVILESRSKVGHREPYANIRFLFGGVRKLLGKDAILDLLCQSKRQDELHG